jgi:hypothetical protein
MQNTTQICKICHSESSEDELVTPCGCRGSIGHMHVHCLINTILYTGSTCGVCKQDYVTGPTISRQVQLLQDGGIVMPRRHIINTTQQERTHIRTNQRTTWCQRYSHFFLFFCFVFVFGIAVASLLIASVSLVEVSKLKEQ